MTACTLHNTFSLLTACLVTYSMTHSSGFAIINQHETTNSVKVGHTASGESKGTNGDAKCVTEIPERGKIRKLGEGDKV